jgi:hypothetical protein
MKRLMRNAVCFILGAALGIGCFAIINRYSVEKHGGDTAGADNNISVVSAQNEGGYKNSDLVQIAYSVASCLRKMDYETLSGYVNPEYGLILSPYPNINLVSNKCLMPGKVAEIGKDDEVYVWGVKDGTEEPIQMTSGEYFSLYVYDRDYLSAPVVSINQTVKSGNSLENVHTVFPEGQYVDFYIPPSSEEALDWSILRLVFEDCNGTLKLSAIIHSQYTV